MKSSDFIRYAQDLKAQDTQRPITEYLTEAGMVFNPFIKHMQEIEKAYLFGINPKMGSASALVDLDL